MATRPRLIFIALIVCAILFWTLLGIFDFIKVEIDRNIDGHVRSNSPPFPDDRFHHLFWVVQISDIHVSRFHDPKRVPDFTRFLEEDLKVIDPHLVLATGDLTDAKSLDGIGSTQYKDEWQQYRDALQKSGVLKWTKWLDVRGNHDAFNVAELKSDSNMFRTHSVKGREEQYNYIENVHIDGSTYSFVAMDACPKPGPKRPFNFFGVLSNESLTELEELSRQTKNSNMTIWFGHYPTSVIVSPYPGVRHFMRGATAYLCGHLHTLAGLVPNMYTMQKSGGLELELGDWKDNRKFRVLAIDHDLMSFTDVSLDDWPIILVTNPKHALFTTPLHEPTGRIRQSSHIRILVFSKSEVASVTVSLDGKYHGLAVSSWKPLYVLPWQPSDFSTGVHEIEVTVKDILGNEKTIKQPFSVDNTKLSFDVLPRMILMANIASVMQVLFGAVYIVYMSVMLTLRFYWRHIAISASLPSCLVNCLKVWSTRLCMLANTDKIFYPLMIFNIYIAVGPWFIGELIDGHIGACFVYGLYTNGTFIPGSLVYAYGILQIVTFNIPLTFYLARCLEFYTAKFKKETQSTKLHIIRQDWPLYLILLWQTWLSYHGFYLAYGGVAFMLCPIRTWSVAFGIILRKRAITCVQEKYGVNIKNGDHKLSKS